MPREEKSWLDDGPIGDWQKPTDRPRSAADPAAMLSHQTTSSEIVSFVNGLSADQREMYHRTQRNMCPPGFRWSSRHKLVAEP